MWMLFRQAGWVAWPLGLCSILAVGIFLERLVTLGSLAKAEEQAFDALRQGSDVVSSAAPIAVILAAVRSLRDKGVSEEAILQAVDIALAQQRLRLRRYLPGLATIGSTAPFIGLFGTVLGVMTAFRGMGQSGLSGETMASGIAEALSATALGLLVAIPAVFAYNYFVGRVQSFVLHIHSQVIQVLPHTRAALPETKEG